MAEFVHRVRVRFGECDPAGIVFFPRLFGWFHLAMEAWFDQGLGRPYAEVIRTGLGFPAVRSEAEFTRPCALGDDLDVRLSVERLGDRSVTLVYAITGASDEADRRATGRTVVVATDLASMRSVPLPDDLRAAMRAYSSESGKSG